MDAKQNKMKLQNIWHPHKKKEEKKQGPASIRRITPHPTGSQTAENEPRSHPTNTPTGIEDVLRLEYPPPLPPFLFFPFCLERTVETRRRWKDWGGEKRGIKSRADGGRIHNKASLLFFPSLLSIWKKKQLNKNKYPFELKKQRSHPGRLAAYREPDADTQAAFLKIVIMIFFIIFFFCAVLAVNARV